MPPLRPNPPHGDLPSTVPSDDRPGVGPAAGDGERTPPSPAESDRPAGSPTGAAPATSGGPVSVNGSANGPGGTAHRRDAVSVEDERLAILRRVAEGQLPAEEAERLLDALDRVEGI